jgi:hypothetical protein
MLSPESWIGAAAKGPTWLLRVANSALRQGLANAVIDPVVQGFNINAGARDRYDPWQTAQAFGAGAAGGAAANSLAGWLEHVGVAHYPAPGSAGSAAKRPLTALQEIQLRRYEQARDLLREIDPNNPQLSALDTSKWFPQSWDVFELREEIARLKDQLNKHPEMFSPEAQRKLSALDDHHLFASAFDYPRASILKITRCIWMQDGIEWSINIGTRGGSSSSIVAIPLSRKHSSNCGK